MCIEESLLKFHFMVSGKLVKRPKAHLEIMNIVIILIRFWRPFPSTPLFLVFVYLCFLSWFSISILKSVTTSASNLFCVLDRFYQRTAHWLLLDIPFNAKRLRIFCQKPVSEHSSIFRSFRIALFGSIFWNWNRCRVHGNEMST